MSGLFYSVFWQQTILQASFQSEAIRHAVVALGLLHESILQGLNRDADRIDTNLVHALQHCNRSIRLLVDSNHECPNLAHTLTICILLATFEAMQGRKENSMAHTLQGAKLLYQLTDADAPEMSSSHTIPLRILRNEVQRLSSRAYALMPRLSSDLRRSRRVPPVSKITSLGEATQPLASMIDAALMVKKLSIRSAADADFAAEEMAFYYAPWLRNWEKAFDSFLRDTYPLMSEFDRICAMVLKANHLFAFIGTEVEYRDGLAGYVSLTPHFRAIVELSELVLQTWHVPPVPSLQYFRRPFLSYGLWLTTPLWIVASRCHDPVLRYRAGRLLSEYPRQTLFHAGPDASQELVQKPENRTAFADMDGWIKLSFVESLTGEWESKTDLELLRRAHEAHYANLIPGARHETRSTDHEKYA
ncbi:hypothetical protein H2203_003560 [Taxawa tesnikishii (nom. ined.)]|nr:hypothetical protein H2203_003560 [Dothideales sp. JES 119]